MRRLGVGFVLVGLLACTSTSPPPARTPTTRTTSSSTTSPPSTASTAASFHPRHVVRASGDVWWRLALCEAHGTNANTGNGYYGYFQWDLKTWRYMGMAGNPTSYSYEEQLAVAKRLQAASGWWPWPTCARKLGLL